MDFRLGPTVEAERRLVHDEDVALAREAFGKGDSLLVAAAEAGDDSLDRWGLHPQTVAVPMNERPLLAPSHTAEAGQAVQRRQRRVFAAIHRQHQAEPLAIFRKEANPGRQRSGDGPAWKFPAMHK